MELRLYKLPEGFIVTSDELPKDQKGYWTYIGFNEPIIVSRCNQPVGWFERLHDKQNYKTVVAQHDQIDFSALSEEEQKEIGWYNVEKLALKQFPYPSDIKNKNDKIISTKGEKPFNHTKIERYRRIWSQGFQKAQELLSDRRFTLDDMKKAIEIALNSSYVSTQHFTGHSTVKHNFTSDEIIQSLSQPKSWKIEVEMEDSFTANEETYIDDSGAKGNYSTHSKRPKLTSGKIKIKSLNL